MALSMLSLSKFVKSYRIWKLVSCQFARHLGHPFSKPNRGASLPPKAASGPAAAEATQRRAAPFCRRHPALSVCRNVLPGSAHTVRRHGHRQNFSLDHPRPPPFKCTVGGPPLERDTAPPRGGPSWAHRGTAQHSMRWSGRI